MLISAKSQRQSLLITAPMLVVSAKTLSFIGDLDLITKLFLIYMCVLHCITLYGFVIGFIGDFDLNAMFLCL